MMVVVPALLVHTVLGAQAGRIAVTGRVTDSTDIPLSGITVRAMPQSFYLSWSDQLQAPSDPREIRAVTDKEGRYHLKGLSAEPYRGIDGRLGRSVAALWQKFSGDGLRLPQEYELVVDASGFAVQRIRITTEKGDLKGADFRLEPAATVRGFAFDTIGRPLPRRDLCLVPEEKQSVQHLSRINVVPYAPATDEHGAFRFERVPPGAYRVRILVYPERGWEIAQSATSGLLLISATDPPVEHKVYFEAPEDRGGITGRVVDAVTGNSIKAFSTRVTRVDSQEAGSPILGCAFVGGTRLALTPSQMASWTQDSFQIEDISPGLATLEICAKGYACDTAQIAVSSGTTTNVSIALKPEGILRGQATRQGRPAYGYVHLWRKGETVESNVSTQTDQRGSYEFRGLSAGDYVVRISVWLLKDNPFSAQIGDMSQARIDLGKITRVDFNFSRNTAISGSFKAADKRLRWRVEVEDASPEAAALPPSDRWRGSVWKIERTGLYSIEGLAPGTYKLTAKCLKNEGPSTIVQQKSRTVSVKDGESAQVDFDLH